MRRTNVIRFSAVCLDPFLAFHQTFRGKNGDMERENYTDQVIQAVAYLSPNVGGHQQPSERVTDHHPKKVTKNCQGMISNAVGSRKKHKLRFQRVGGPVCRLHGKKISTGNTKSHQNQYGQWEA